MFYATIGNISVFDLGREDKGLKLYALSKDHTDDDFPNIVVPRGFITNGASIPKYVRKLISPTGDMFRAAVVHDYIYYTHIRERKVADAIFRDIVIDDTGRYFLAWGAYLALRAFGGRFWKRGPFDIEQVYLKEGAKLCLKV